MKTALSCILASVLVACAPVPYQQQAQPVPAPVYYQTQPQQSFGAAFAPYLRQALIEDQQRAIWAQQRAIEQQRYTEQQHFQERLLHELRAQNGYR